MIFHFTNRGDGGHNRTRSMNPKALERRVGRPDRRGERAFRNGKLIA
jgi:hypothetical protein